MSLELPSQVENHLQLLSPQEKANISFSFEIKRKLQEAEPEASELPLIYIGSGGDVLTALLVSGSKRIVLIDSHPFLTKETKKDEQTETYSTVEEMLTAVDPRADRIGLSTHWQSVRPAVQMIAQLEKIGIPREDIDIETNGENADLTIHLGDETVVVNFRSRKIYSFSDLKFLLGQLKINDGYGLLAKAGGGGTVQTIIEQSHGSESVVPSYFVVDDPRSEANKALTAKEEEDMYPGYDLTENKSNEKTLWGYSWGDDSNSSRSTEKRAPDYKTRAVIGILK